VAPDVLASFIGVPCRLLWGRVEGHARTPAGTLNVVLTGVEGNIATSQTGLRFYAPDIIAAMAIMRPKGGDPRA
jgi:hypothetical protein